MLRHAPLALGDHRGPKQPRVGVDVWDEVEKVADPITGEEVPIMTKAGKVRAGSQQSKYAGVLVFWDVTAYINRMFSLNAFPGTFEVMVHSAFYWGVCVDEVAEGASSAPDLGMMQCPSSARGAE